MTDNEALARGVALLPELRSAASAATPGPWAYEAHGDTMQYGVGVLIDPCGDGDDQCTGEQISGVMIVAETVAVEVHGQANAAYIATANPKTVLTIIAALESAERIAKPVIAGGVDRWKMVPVEPTEAMIEAWEKSKPYDGDYTNEKCATACWKDMVAAALRALATLPDTRPMKDET